MLWSEQKPTCGFIGMVIFHTPLRRRGTIWKYEGTKSYIKYMPLIAGYLNVPVEELMGDDIAKVMKNMGTMAIRCEISASENSITLNYAKSNCREYMK